LFIAGASDLADYSTARIWHLIQHSRNAGSSRFAPVRTICAAGPAPRTLR
jgi:hypothetical protein